MKMFCRRIFVLCLALLLCASTALAAVPATPNQRLSFRTGPNTKYAELFTLPETTVITAYEYEEGNDVTWVLVEFFYKGQRMRGYTGLKRMTVHGDIPWANHWNESVSSAAAAPIYAAPAADAAVRGELGIMEWVTLLRIDGDYAYIEYTDSATGLPSRGWTPAWALNIDHRTNHGVGDSPSSGVITGSVSVPMYVDLAAPMYNLPDYASTAARVIPQYAVVECFGHLFCGFSIVEYGGYTGYVPSHFLTTFE